MNSRRMIPYKGYYLKYDSYRNAVFVYKYIAGKAVFQFSADNDAEAKKEIDEELAGKEENDGKDLHSND